LHVSAFSLAVHGGAGGFGVGEPGEQGMREAIAACLEEGRAQLEAGAPALDVVEAVVRRLEAHALFNAGRGSALTAAGTVEMDAAVMDGRERRTGAVACVRTLAHPVSAARLVMERSRHVLLAGVEADRFAREAGLETREPAGFVTEERRAQLERAQAKDEVHLDHDANIGGAPDGGGTVGAVARDAAGHLAAATSTGGMTNQLPGRVGDSPIAGAGTWADDATCAVSATGRGEAFIRTAVAHEVDAGMRLGGLPLATACERALARAKALGGRGGLIAVDAAGRLALPYNSRGMLRGWLDESREPRVRIFADE
jgi:isoaspartyl peptidase/L-asparaginase-like protein (Ntn-hydrolase superfamily)